MGKVLRAFGAAALVAFATQCGFVHRALAESAGGKNSDIAAVEDSLNIRKQAENLKILQADLNSGKPTLAFFYYSVACSCTAARCAIAAAAIDSLPELNGKNDALNFASLDSYLIPEGDSLFNLMIMPAVIYFDKNGNEVNRLEWGTSREAIKMLIEHPDIIQIPID